MNCPYCNGKVGERHASWCPNLRRGKSGFNPSTEDPSPYGVPPGLGLSFGEDPATGDVVAWLRGEELGRMHRAEMERMSSGAQAAQLSMAWSCECTAEALRRLHGGLSIGTVKRIGWEDKQ